MSAICAARCGGHASASITAHAVDTSQIPPGDYGNLHAQYNAIMADGNNHGFKSWDDFKAKAASAIAAAQSAGLMQGDTGLEKLQTLAAAFKSHAGANGIFSFDADQNDVPSMMQDYGLTREQVNSLKFLLDTADANGHTDAQLTMSEMTGLQRSPVTDDVEKFMNYM